MPASRVVFEIITSEMWWDVRRCWEIHGSGSGTEKFVVTPICQCFEAEGLENGNT